MTTFLQVRNDAISTLAAGISDAATSLTVASGEGARFPQPGNGFHISIGNEILRCTARSGDVFTVIRAQEGTTAAAHNAGASVELRITAAIIQQLQDLKTRFVPKSVSQEVWRRDNANNSSFEALIDATGSGGLTTTNVPYKNDVRENSLPEMPTYPQFGRVILYNITRGNSRRITGVNLATNVITTESSTDNWANNDVITIGSRTCTYLLGQTYSRYFDVDISAEVPASAFAVLLEVFNVEMSGVGAHLQNCFGCHPFEAFADSKASHHSAAAPRQVSMSYIVIPVRDRRICVQIGAFGSVNASNTIALIRLRGYWE